MIPEARALIADGDTLLDPELSLLAFQRRVLALAEDPTVPLIERLRFLGIVTSNLDEIYMLRMAELRRAAVDEVKFPDAAKTSEFSIYHSAISRLEEIEQQIGQLLTAQSRCADVCLREAATMGVQLQTWEQLDDAARASLRDRYLEEIQPDLMTHAITLSPGFPLPHLPHLGLFVAIVFRAAPGERARLAEHELPRDVARLFPVPGRVGAVIAIEEVLRANAHLLYPGSVVDGAYLFRVTRGGELPIEQNDSGDLLGAVALATERRPHNPAVRVEVERRMPAHIGALIVESLRREAIGRDMELTVNSVQVVDGLLDLRCLQSLPLPDVAALQYAPLVSANPFRDVSSMFDVVRARDVLLHHPFESFDESVVRFVCDAADDPDVAAISMTLYRVGNPSPIVEALLTAARNGKKVFAMVELQARFDEEHNVHWARALERAGGRVRYGLTGLKVHAKAALIVRREAHGTSTYRTDVGEERCTCYVHIGTGNYNTRSGKQYTDLSLFSSRVELAEDVAALFVALDSDEGSPAALRHGALVAPQQLLPTLLARIEREAEHARAGHDARISIKINGLADTEVVRALYAASEAGVVVELIVRGICTLRPSVAGLSERITVVSVVGRWLEHSRIYRFANNGAPEYFIGSSDLRPRNLRRRVELLVPVVDPAHQSRLDDILTRYQHDPSASSLTARGTYEARGGVTLSAQQSFARDVL